MLKKALLIIIVWVSTHYNIFAPEFTERNLKDKYYNRELRLQNLKISRFLDYNRLGLRILDPKYYNMRASKIVSLQAPLILRNQFTR